MKNLLLLMLVFITTVSAQAQSKNVSTIAPQRCDELITKKYDKITGVMSIATKYNFLVATDGNATANIILILSTYDKKFTHISFLIAGKGYSVCPDAGDEINFLFKDSTRHTSANVEKLNCQGIFKLLLSNTGTQAEKITTFSNHKIEAMRLHTKTTLKTFEFTDTQSQDFYDAINCLTSYIGKSAATGE